MPRKPTRIPGVTVRQRGHAWQAQVRAGRDPRTGKYVYACATADTEAAAWEAGRRLLAKAEAQRAAHVDPTRQSLAEYLAGWLERKKAEGRKPSTMWDYGRLVQGKIIPSLGDSSLQDLSPAMIQDWQDALAPTPSAPGAARAAGAYRVLRSALSDATRLGLLASNPAKRARPAQRSTRKREGFTLEEALRVLRAAKGERFDPLFAFMLHSGVRVGEALGLRWPDIDFEARTVVIRTNRVEVGARMVEGTPKTRTSARTFVLLAGAVAALQQQRTTQAQERLAAGAAWREGGWVFTSVSGAPLSTTVVGHVFVRIRRRAGVRPLPLYSLRHAAASILLSAGVPVGVAAKMMGHSVTMFCETYADLLLEATREAAQQADAWLAAQGGALPNRGG